MDKLLIVEDDLDIANLVKVNLNELGFELDHRVDGISGLDAALSQTYSLVILDVMLPKMNGLDICRKIRDQKPEQAILMLTAKNSETDRVLGLELGADDYMAKPFSVRELQARVRALLRRADLVRQNQRVLVDNSNSLICGDLVVDRRTRTVAKSGKCIELTATEFDLLFHLMQHPNQVFSRSQLLESVWGYQHCGYEHTVNSHINRLRSKLEKDATNPDYVQTVWGVGYKFNQASVVH
ncbi:response regulator transcription factor [Glaciecola sp. 1036]|uniref:response regulator transcription factor n=1 Tax=Alteromonadaceae TaxID=72275 RepID=UPI003D01C853